MLKASIGLMRAGSQRLLRGTPVEFRNRTGKAQMIEAILSRELGGPVEGFDLLDVGCGNGDISRFFAPRNRVTGVDVRDRRNGRLEPFRFVQIESEALPFDDASFDLVVSHHVIEHVPDQRRHLDEIWRVLRPEGVCYLATPNKSSPIMRGHVGNILVLRYRQMQPLFEERHFSVVERSTDVFVRPDLYHHPLKLGRVVPRRVAHAVRSLFPSHMFILRKASRRFDPAEPTHEHTRS
jgi:SAM-dependent methyltransferase